MRSWNPRPLTLRGADWRSPRRVPATGCGVLRLLDLDAGKTNLVLPSSQQQINHVTFSRDGQWLAASCWDKTLAPGEAVIWRVDEPGRPAARLPHKDGVLFTSFSDSGRMLATASEDKTAIVWRWTNDTWQSSFRPLDCGGEVYACSFSHNGRWLATANRTPEAQQFLRWEQPDPALGRGEQRTDESPIRFPRQSDAAGLRRQRYPPVCRALAAPGTA